MSLIQKAFAQCKKNKRPALLTYTVAGDPNKKKSLQILKSISKHADILEVGIPHNTPTADGGQIQNSSYRALKKGIKIKDVFHIVKAFKKSKYPKPIILMGYYNPILQFGVKKFIASCKSAKVSGLIVVDLPWPENQSFANLCKKNGISFIQLIAPTTSEKRMKSIMKASHDMIYYISMLSTTGGKLKVSPQRIIKNYLKIKKLSKNKNVVIGFGITEKTIKSLVKADGLVVGSALCKAITQSLPRGKNPVLAVEKMVKNLRAIIS